jgi:hypothetical protein
MPTKVQDARIACLDMNLQKSRMMMGMQVLVTDPKELEKVWCCSCLSAIWSSSSHAFTACADPVTRVRHHKGAHPEDPGHWCQCNPNHQSKWVMTQYLKWRRLADLSC